MQTISALFIVNVSQVKSTNALVRCIISNAFLKQLSRTHASPLLQSLHWLPIEKRILFKLIVQAFKAFHFSSPGYLSSYFQCRVHKTKYSLRSDLAITFEVPPARNKRAIVPFLWLGLIFGMGSRAVSVQSIIWTGSKTNLNLIFFLILPSAFSTL